MFDNNLGECGPIFKIFSPVPCSMLLYYLVKFKNRKMLPNYYIERNN